MVYQSLFNSANYNELNYLESEIEHDLTYELWDSKFENNDPILTRVYSTISKLKLLKNGTPEQQFIDTPAFIDFNNLFNIGDPILFMLGCNSPCEGDNRNETFKNEEALEEFGNYINSNELFPGEVNALPVGKNLSQRHSITYKRKTKSNRKSNRKYKSLD